MGDDENRTNPRVIGNYLGINYSTIQGLIRQADAKANILLALIGVILSIFFNYLISKNNQLPMWQIGLILTLLIISGASAITALYPRASKPTGNFSMTYFKDAQKIDTKKWTKKFLTSDQEEIITLDLMNNIKAISMILEKKYKRLRIAYSLLGITIIIKLIFDLKAFL